MLNECSTDKDLSVIDVFEESVLERRVRKTSGG